MVNALCAKNNHGLYGVHHVIKKGCEKWHHSVLHSTNCTIILYLHQIDTLLLFYIHLHLYTLFGPPSTSSPTHLASRQKLFYPPLLQFCGGENIKDNKKDIVVFLVWDEDSSTERFLALLPCSYALKPTLVRLCQTTSLLPGPLPIVVSASFRLLYSLLFSKHINHIQVLGFLPFLYSSSACSPLSVWPMSNNITAFVLGR
jgi:hypothetical protein